MSEPGRPPASQLRRGALLTALLALGLGGISAYRLASRPEPPGLPPELAVPTFPSCDAPVAVLWEASGLAPEGERLGCLGDLRAMLTEAAERGGCDLLTAPGGGTRALPTMAAGERLRLFTAEGGGCVGAVEMLPGSALKALGLPIDLNRARAEDLQVLEALGPTRARAIVAHREQKGPFATVEALQEVSGIGPATLEAVRAHLWVAPKAETGGR